MKFILGLGLFFMVIAAQAEIVFAPAASYLKIEDENAAGAVSEIEITNYDFKLGYVHASGLYLGGMYQMTTLNNDDGYSVGPTLGFNHYSGFYALFTYFLVAEQDLDPSTTLTAGMGPQVDIGWVFPVTHTFFIGPQISYRSISYDTVDANGVESDTDYTRTNMLPYVSLWFRF